MTRHPPRDLAELRRLIESAALRKLADRADETVPSIAEANLAAFFRHRADVPAQLRASLTGSLAGLRRSDDPVVTFGGLPRVCVPEFADGCQVEMSDGTEPLFRVSRPASLADDPDLVAAHPVRPDQVLATPFRAVSRAGYPSYAGVITYWWTSRSPSESDATIAGLLVGHVVALVDHERLKAAAAQAEDQAASLALQAVSGRTISLATGIVMHQDGLTADDAEDLLRQSAAMTGSSLHQVAIGVVRSGSFGASRAVSNGVPRHIPH